MGRALLFMLCNERDMDLIEEFCLEHWVGILGRLIHSWK